MTALVLGLVLFLGAHSVRIAGEGWRERTIARIGDKRWKGAYSLVSIVGFVLLVWGYGLARHAPVLLWGAPPAWVRHLTALLVLAAFVLVTAAYVPGNQLKAKLHHPMVLGVKLWAFGHLIANNTLADVVLFGAFLVWAVLDFRASRRRDRTQGTSYPPGTSGRTAVTLGVGLVAWVVFGFWLHALLIGVSPMGR